MGVDFSNDIKKKITGYLSRYETKRSSIIPILHLIQSEYGWISNEQIDILEKDYQFLYKAKEMEIVNHSFKDAAFRDQFPFLSKGEGIFT